MTEDPSFPAGEFSSWLEQTRNSLESEAGIDVPCGECVACCTSSYFIHIRPGETETLARIPKKLLFPAPGLPKGNMLLGYDERGHCPMFTDGACSIYEHRPLTCRGYDCRLFASAGIPAGEADKQSINERACRWKFTYPTLLDRDLHSAVRTAVRFLREHTGSFPEGFVPGNPTQLALLALKIHRVFLRINEESAQTGSAPPDMEIVQAVLKALDRRTHP